jgi:hypothetical protein
MENITSFAEITQERFSPCNSTFMRTAEYMVTISRIVLTLWTMSTSMIVIFRNDAAGRELVMNQPAAMGARDSVAVDRFSMGQPVNAFQSRL